MNEKRLSSLFPIPLFIFQRIKYKIPTFLNTNLKKLISSFFVKKFSTQFTHLFTYIVKIILSSTQPFPYKSNIN